MNKYQKWIDAKEAEKTAIDLRRSLEDDMVMDFDISKSLDGTQNIDVDGYKVKIVGRLDRRVNSDILQDLAAEHGLTEHLTTLFRWKPEVSVAAFKSADVLITGPLLGAITTTPGRPSFTITKE